VLQLTNTQANYYWLDQIHCGGRPPNRNFGLVMAHPSHPAAPNVRKCVIQNTDFLLRFMTFTVLTMSIKYTICCFLRMRTIL